MHRPFSRSTRTIPPSVGGSAPDRSQAAGDLRCSCHRLLARAVGSGIELRCPRCKSNVVLSWERIRALEASGETVAIG